MAQRIGDRWEIQSQIGEGGQAWTFLVVDINDGTRAVVKRLKNPNRLPRFRQEVAAIHGLDHRHILKLIAHDTEDRKPYLVSEYCELRSLEDQWPAINQLSVAERLDIAAQIAEGLGQIHAAGIVHRDLKPSNIFIRRFWEVVIGDFGVCFIQTPERLTETVEAVGARFYMAPELADGRADQVTWQTDMYALGKIIYWLLTGKAFDREDHRRKDRLLTNYYSDDTILHIHQLLDSMITFDPSRRILDGPAVQKNIALLHRLVGRYPTLEHPPRYCQYCGLGTYRKLNSSKEGSPVFQFGLQPANDVPNIFVCSNCGHVQMFRPAYAKHAGWLDP